MGINVMGKGEEETTTTKNGKSFWTNPRLLAALIIVSGSIIATVITLNLESKSILSNRELAAHELQAKVFEIYVENIVPELGKKGNDLRKVALLAGLHSNFSKFFDTRTAFEAFAADIEDHIARYELRRLAKRVARQQADFIKGHMDGINIDTTIFMTWHAASRSVSRNRRRELETERRSRHEHETVESGDQEPEKEHLITLGKHKFKLRLKKEPHRHYKIDTAIALKRRFPALADDGDRLIDDVSDFVTIEIQFVDHEVDSMKKDTVDHHENVITIEVSYMDTPYMDNFGARHHSGSGASKDGGKTGHRMSLRLRDIDTIISSDSVIHIVKIEILHFESDIYAASQRLDI